MTKNKVKLPNFGTILLGLAAVVNLARWVGMFTLSDTAPAWVLNIIPILEAVSGLMTGLTIAGGLAFVAHRMGGLQPFTPKGKPQMRFWGALISGASILVMSAFLLPPYVRMMTPEKLRVEIADLRAWSVMAVLVGDLIIVAIALADGKSAGFTRSADAGTASGTPATDTTRSGKKVKPLKAQVMIACRYEGTGCDRNGTQNAMNAHAKHCKYKPSIDDSLMLKNKLENKL